MRVLILNGSPRLKGETAKMVQAFSEGLEKAGHEWTVINVAKLDIHGCLACEYCHGKGTGKCIQKDEMQPVYEQLKTAEMLVIASPIYYHGLSGQMKCCIDRFYSALYPKAPATLKKVAMFLASGDPNMYDGAVFSYKGDFLDYLGLEGCGVFNNHDPKHLEKIRSLAMGLE